MWTSVILFWSFVFVAICWLGALTYHFLHQKEKVAHHSDKIVDHGDRIQTIEEFIEGDEIENTLREIINPLDKKTDGINDEMTKLVDQFMALSHTLESINNKDKIDS